MPLNLFFKGERVAWQPSSGTIDYLSPGGGFEGFWGTKWFFRGRKGMGLSRLHKYKKGGDNSKLAVN